MNEYNEDFLVWLNETGQEASEDTWDDYIESTGGQRTLREWFNGEQWFDRAK